MQNNLVSVADLEGAPHPRWSPICFLFSIQLNRPPPTPIQPPPPPPPPPPYVRKVSSVIYRRSVVSVLGYSGFLHQKNRFHHHHFTVLAVAEALNLTQTTPTHPLPSWLVKSVKYRSSGITRPLVVSVQDTSTVNIGPKTSPSGPTLYRSKLDTPYIKIYKDI